MPTKPLHPCNAPRCPHLTDVRHCAQHRKESRQRVDAQRPSASARGYGRKWQEVSKAFTAKHRVCEIRGPRCAVRSQCIDHIDPPKGDMAKFWNRRNWQPACLACNSAKNVASEGGFGNPVRVSA